MILLRRTALCIEYNGGRLKRGRLFYQTAELEDRKDDAHGDKADQAAHCHVERIDVGDVDLLRPVGESAQVIAQGVFGRAVGRVIVGAF